MRTRPSRTGMLEVALCGALFAAPGSGAAAGPAPDVLRWRALPPLPSGVGLAGSFAGVSADVLIVAGGTSLPQGPAGKGGAKRWHDRIVVLDDPDGGWRDAGRLPRPLADGLSVSTRKGVVCVG